MTLLEVFVGILAAAEGYTAIRCVMRDARVERMDKRHLELNEQGIQISQDNARSNEKYSREAFEKARLQVYADAYTRGVDDAQKRIKEAAPK